MNDIAETNGQNMAYQTVSFGYNYNHHIVYLGFWWSFLESEDYLKVRIAQWQKAMNLLFVDHFVGQLESKCSHKVLPSNNSTPTTQCEWQRIINVEVAECHKYYSLQNNRNLLLPSKKEKRKKKSTYFHFIIPHWIQLFKDIVKIANDSKRNVYGMLILLLKR